MPLRMWTYDLAREQCPSRDFLARLCTLSLDAGYDALGLYLEHRFRFPSAPWAHGQGALEPETVTWLRREFPSLRLIPFINLLGHMEGFLYTERGKRFAEVPFRGLQACPSNAELTRFAGELLDNTLSAFDDELVHLGGDETAQLGACDECAKTPKSKLYADHFKPLCEKVISAGKRPALWGDMFLEHPEALDSIPKETLIFDWQYFESPLESSRHFKEKGFEVVCCPTLHTYNSTWLNVRQAEENVRQAHEAAQELGAGLCVTTWECALMGNYETLFPAIRWAASGEGSLLDAYSDDRDWAQHMGVDLVDLGGPFAEGKIRSGLKCRLLLYANPFLAWLRHGADLAGPIGDEALRLARQALTIGSNSSYRGVGVFLEKAIEFVQLADQARQAYAQGLPGVAVASLAPCRQIFDELAKVARATHLNAGGSLADIERCRIARDHVEVVIRRIRDYGSGQLGYLPSFEAITHPQFCPHDQGCWWKINTWANE